MPAHSLDFLGGLPAGCAHLCKTSPPFWGKRDYGTPPQAWPDGWVGELGREPEPGRYVDHLVVVVNAIGRVLAPGACLLLNLGDTYGSQPGGYRGDPERVRGVSPALVRANGTALADRVLDVPEKSLLCIPERVVATLTGAHGWRLAAKIIWVKVGHAGENVYDRAVTGWEPIYVLTRSEHAYWRRKTGEPDDPEDDVWPIRVGRGGAAQGHLAPFPEALVERALRHACPPGGTVLDPFAGSGTVRDVAVRMGRRFLGCDLLGEPGA